MSTPAISTERLTRRFGARTAVDSIDLMVPRGSVYGFLGPNGSGKTTTIRMLLGLISADSGQIEVLGQQMPKHASVVLPLVGALIEGPAFHPYLSGRDNLVRLDRCDAYADPVTSAARIERALGRVGLTAASAKRYRQYSLGMKQRLGMAAALLQERDLLVLDEPTNGLDPQGTREVRNLIRALSAEGTTVLVSSHLLSEVEQVATHVGIMSVGRLLAQGPLHEVLSGTEPRLTVSVDDVVAAAAILERLGLANLRTTDTGLTAANPDVDVAAINRELVLAGVAVSEIKMVQPALEDLFVGLTGEGFDVAG